METTNLLAWAVPDHVSGPVEELRIKLFQQTGCISLRALDVLIPIGYVPEPLTKQELPHDIPKPGRITWNSVTIADGSLFITSSEPFTLSDSHLRFSVSGPSPIPPLPGIFLGSGDLTIYLESYPELKDSIPGMIGELCFTPAHIVQICISYPCLEEWWKDFTFSVTKLKSLK